MAWEKRQRGSQYYTRSVRQEGRIIRQYVGRGPTAELIAQADQERRQEEAQARELARQDLPELIMMDTLMHALCAEVDQITRIALEAAGYHQHARGEWRKKRMSALQRLGNKIPPNVGIQELMQLLHQAYAGDSAALDQFCEWVQIPRDLIEEDLAGLITELSGAQQQHAEFTERAQRGDLTVIPEVNQLLDQHPEILQNEGNFAARTEAALLKVANGTDLIVNEATRRQMQGMREAVLGNNPTQLERLLAERIVMCHFTLNYFETIYLQKQGQLSEEQEALHQRRIDGAQKRYLAAIKTLAQVRKLQVPDVQVNIGEKQINLLQSGTQVNGLIEAQTPSSPGKEPRSLPE